MSRKLPFLHSLLVLMLGASCSAPQESAEVARRMTSIPADFVRVETHGRAGGALRYALAGEPRTFNPLAAQDNRSKLVAYLTAGTLLEFDASTQKVVGAAAKEWEFAEDGVTMTLKLRRDLRFSDGAEFSADDVLFTLERIYDRDSKNAAREAFLIDGEPIQVVPIDSHTLQLRFPRPHAAAEYLLTQFPVLPRHLFAEAEKNIEMYWGLETPPEQMAGLGPFVLDRHQPGLKTVFKRNPHYWKVDRSGVQLPYLEEFEIHYVEDRSNQVLRLQAGQLDLIDYLLTPEDFLHLSKQGKPIEVGNAGPSSRVMIYWFNLGPVASGKDASSVGLRRGWFERLEFRQAVSTAISRKTISQNVFQGQARPAWGLVPSSIERWFAVNVQQYEYSRENARALLRRAGFSWRLEGAREILLDSQGHQVEFEILTRSDGLLGKIAAVIQNDLEALGMQVGIRQEEFLTVISRYRAGDYDSVLISLEIPSEPSDHGNVLLSSGQMHMWNPNQKQPATEWENRTDALMLEQVRTLDAKKRKRLYGEIQQILAQQVPFVPLVNQDLLLAWNISLKNVRASSLFPFALWNVWELNFDDTLAH